MTTIANTSGTVPLTLPIRPFTDLSNADLDYAGGKGTNLGSTQRSACPPGFVVRRACLRRVPRASGLDKRLQDLLWDLDVEDTAALQEAAETARQAVRDSHMPVWLSDAIGAAYDELSAGDPEAPSRSAPRRPVDTASASFAGMNETFSTAGA